MELIDKAAIVEELERLYNLEYSNTSDLSCGKKIILRHIRCFLNTLETKGVDLNEEIESYFKGFGKFPSVGIGDCIDIAKHFFEFGLKSKSFYVDIPNIDDTLKEMGVDPNSKSAESFKESYYMALEKFKAQKGEEV